MGKLFTALVLALTLAACASVPVKQKALTTMQISTTALGAAQDFELANHTALNLDVPAFPAEVEKCTKSAPAGLVSLPATPTRHNVFGCLFAIAFNAKIKVDQDLIAWEPGTTPPTSVVTLKQQIDLIFTLAKDVVGGASAQKFIQMVKDASDNALTMYQLVTGGAN